MPPPYKAALSKFHPLCLQLEKKKSFFSFFFLQQVQNTIHLVIHLISDFICAVWCDVGSSELLVNKEIAEREVTKMLSQAGLNHVHIEYDQCNYKEYFKCYH